MTSAPVRAAIFDFDGTLADTAPDMVLALNRWLAARNRAAVEYEQVRMLCSGGSRALLNFCGIGEEPWPDAVADYLQHYEDTGYRQTALFPGVADALTALADAGWCWGIATNKPRRYFAPIAERLLSRWQPAALIARNDDNLPAKPHPATLLAAAQQCGAAPAACVYIGDDLRDGAAAQAAGMPFIAVTWGYWQPEQWQQATPPPIAARLDSPAQLTEVLRQR